MPRRQRIHVPGGTYYVVRRTHSTRPVFSRPEDYSLFEDLLRAALKRTGTQLLGYCWMPNAFPASKRIFADPRHRPPSASSTGALHVRRVHFLRSPASNGRFGTTYRDPAGLEACDSEIPHSDTRRVDKDSRPQAW